MRVVEYRFDLMAECPQCYNITKQMRMVLQGDDDEHTVNGISVYTVVLYVGY